MNVRMKVLCAAAAISFLASVSCFSAYAVQLYDRASADDEEAVASYQEPTVDPTPSPEPTVSVEPTVSTEPDYNTGETSQFTGQESEPTYSEYEENTSNSSSVESYEETTSSVESDITVSDLINESNYPQADSSTTSDYSDYTQSSAYVNPYSSVYDDNYVSIPTYTEPTESLIDTSSKQINTDELTADDWNTIMLDLEAGNVSADGTNTFNFIKQNDEIGDTSMAWLLYLGSALILLAIFLIIFVIISTKKANRKYAA